MNISEKIYTRRKQLGYTLQEIADYVGVQKSTMHYWETGEIKSMKIGHINKLSEKLKVDPISLINDNESLAIVGEEPNEMELFDRELCELVLALPFKEKIALYSKLSKK